jgi:S1-C subfamily serine protease
VAPTPPAAASPGWFSAHPPAGEVKATPPAPESTAAPTGPVTVAATARDAAAAPAQPAVPGPATEGQGAPPAQRPAAAPAAVRPTEPRPDGESRAAVPPAPAPTVAPAGSARAAAAAARVEAHEAAQAVVAEAQAAAAEAEAAVRSAEAATGSADSAAAGAEAAATRAGAARGSAEAAAAEAEAAAADAEAVAGSAAAASGSAAAASGSAEATAKSATTAAAGAEAAAAGAEAARRSAEAAAGSEEAARGSAATAAGSVEAAVGSAEAAAGSARAADVGAQAAVRSAEAAAGSVETAIRSAEAAAGSVESAMRSAEAAAGSARAADVGAQAAVRSAEAAARSVETAIRSAEAAAGSEVAVRPRPVTAEVTRAARRGPRRLLGVGALLLVVAVASGLAGGLVGATVTRDRERATASGRQGTAPAGPDRTPSSEQVQQVAASVLPAVVRVQARTSNGRATGSGVIFAANGYVLTNAHVVDGARTIAVTLATAEPLKASLVGTDPVNDLAVLRVRRSALPVASFGRSADLAVGDAAIVVGSPFGFEGSVTSGIVSALHRVVRVPGDQGPGTGNELVDAIQTDAAINPGNSGGALADGNGLVVGISTAIATSGNVESSAGVGFAIPIDEALAVARALVAKKPVRVPYLGWEVADLSAESAARYRLQGRAGALLEAVRPGSPAAKAELRRGDLVVRFGDVPVRNGDQLAVALRKARVGEPVPILIVRRGRELDLLAVPTSQPRR